MLTAPAIPTAPPILTSRPITSLSNIPTRPSSSTPARPSHSPLSSSHPRLLLDPWTDAFNLWLASRPSENTRRAYLTSWRLFTDFTQKPPHRIGRADIASWIDHLRSTGASPTTIRQRLAAISSFYTYTSRTYTTIDDTGSEHPLHTFNPASAVPLPRVTPYGKAIYLSTSETRAFLNAIPRHTLQGKRDYALFLTYLATGRRNSEIRHLTWGDLETSSPLPPSSMTMAFAQQIPQPISKTQPYTKIFYRWSGKGKQRRDECPLPVYHAILDYLQAAGRLPTIQPTDHIFTPLNHNATRLHNARPAPSAIASSPSARPVPSTSPHHPSTPLSARMLSTLVKKYARRASLDPRRITIHTLRHTAAMLRKEAGDDLESISAFLGHSTLAITQIYLHTVEGHSDTTWQKVEQLLGLTPASSPLDTHPTKPCRLPRRPRATSPRVTNPSSHF